MPKWIPCGSGFIEADVIRWEEAVWQRPKRERGHAVNLGDRVVTAEVIRDEGGCVDLIIRGCAVSNEKPGRKVEILAKDTEIRRRRSTIEQGKPERLMWSDESARTTVASSLFWGGDNSF